MAETTAVLTDRERLTPITQHRLLGADRRCWPRRLGKRRRRCVTVRGTKAKAQRRLWELLSTLDRGTEIPDGRILLRDWLDRWMRERIAPHRWQRQAAEAFADAMEKAG